MNFHYKKHTIFLLIFVVLVISGVSLWNSVQSKNLEKVSVENETSSLEIESIRELKQQNQNQDVIEVLVKNISKKNITTLRFRQIGEFDDKNEIHAVERGGLEISWSLKPNETHAEKFIISSKEKVKIIIAAVSFDDGTGNGNRADLIKLQENRVGVMAGYFKIAGTIREYLNSGEMFTSNEAIESLKEKIQKLDNKDVPQNSKSGFRLVIDYLVIELEDMKKQENTISNLDNKQTILDKLTKIDLLLTKFQNDLSLRTGKEEK